MRTEPLSTNQRLPCEAHQRLPCYTNPSCTGDSQSWQSTSTTISAAQFWLHCCLRPTKSVCQISGGLPNVKILQKRKSQYCRNAMSSAVTWQASATRAPNLMGKVVMMHIPRTFERIGALSCQEPRRDSASSTITSTDEHMEWQKQKVRTTHRQMQYV